ncbi:hypothetical protein C6Q11_05490 [Burkholderia multivorans]|uniref:hypothetical protein n=1 Tax=Burkholderia multivorans TaxID=87883 RepID=UPI000D00C9A8|nr:hypothetical protein [Burkholderia multivorans]PRF55367.1 hypothetical protein C6Q11_05490 [Burkholderia multivorans]
MNDQQQSRADALTDRQRRIMDEAANGPHLRPVAWAVYNGWSRICFYMTEEDARDHAQKAQKNHDLSGSLAAFRVVPLYAAPQPAQADARVGLTEQAITDAVKKWFPDRAYQAPFFARALLQGANHV